MPCQIGSEEQEHTGAVKILQQLVEMDCYLHVAEETSAAGKRGAGK